MKSLKKMLCALLAVAMITAAFAGCDKDKKSTSSTADSSEASSEATTTSAPDSSEDGTTTTSATTAPDDSSDSTADTTTTSSAVSAGATVTTISNPKPASTNLNSAVANNSDTVAWIKISGTFVDYPVLMKTNADEKFFYLNHDENKNYSKAGSLFADYRSSFSSSGQSDNIVIYGHNMANGSYFGSLNNYKQLKFYKNNSLITFNTKYKNASYVIVACFYANTVASDDNGTVFSYHNYQNFGTQADFNYWKENVKKRSWYNEAIDYNIDDKYITLSTCTNMLNEGRIVVIAREVRSGETINTNNIAVNPSIYFPQDWYDKYGDRVQP
ncbi:MAG: class B sortase [Oscillospiraceae bacterium]|jgi:sortase B